MVTEILYLFCALLIGFSLGMVYQHIRWIKRLKELGFNITKK